MRPLSSPASTTNISLAYAIPISPLGAALGRSGPPLRPPGGTGAGMMDAVVRFGGGGGRAVFAGFGEVAFVVAVIVAGAAVGRLGSIVASSVNEFRTESPAEAFIPAEEYHSLTFRQY